MTAINIISATKLGEQAFWETSMLGRSLRSFTAWRIRPLIAFGNRDGLSAVYNRAIARCAGDDIMVFVHDDVLFADLFWIDHLLAALNRFDIVGVAGTARRVPGQDRWFWADHAVYKQNETLLSGYIGNGESLPCKISAFGPVGRPCQLLDGVFLAARKSSFQARSLAFDERFSFHFYDLDLCREAEMKGLRMGTADISLVHRSEGLFGGEAWEKARETYLAKWGE